MLSHPTKHELMAYAESLVDSQVKVSAQLAAHMASCEACAAEVQAIRGNLAVVAHASDLEPSQEFTARILKAAREQRHRPHARKRTGVRACVVLAKGAAVAATLLVVASVSFNAALGEPQGHASPSSTRVTTVAAPVANAAEAETQEVGVDPSQVVREIQTFAAAVSAGQRPLGVWEREQWRSVLDLDTELQAAMEALEKNPGCARANHVVQANLQRKAQTLRSIYIRGD